MSFSPKVLANIKQANDSDEDDNGNALLAVVHNFPEATTSVDPIEEILPRCEDFKVEPEAIIDPLFSNVETCTQSGFVGAYQDSEILRTDESDDNEDNVACHANKRKRLQNEMKGRNGYIWTTNRTTTVNDTLNSALQYLQPKGKGPANTINNILEMWSLLVDEQIISQIVHYTNIDIRQRKAKFPHQRLIDAVELRAWIGLNYLCGIFRNAAHNGPLDELWSMELGNAIFRATMPVKRFKFILESIQFGEKQKQKMDKTRKSDMVLDVWNKFLVNCRSYYAPSGNCSVGEVLMNFTNVINVPHLLMMCDVKTLYMCNAVLSPLGDHKERDVFRLVSDIKGSKRNIVLPPQLTSVELTNKLLEMGMSVLGILPNTAKEIPPEFISNSTRQKIYSKSVNLISTKQNSGILLTGGIPKIIKVEHLYNLSCNACRSYQETACRYSTSNATQPTRNCWSLTFFQNILDYALVNAWILFVLSSNGDSSMKQRDFQRHLGLYLTQQQLKRQLQSNRLTLPQKVHISDVLGEPTDQIFATATTINKNDISIGSIPQEKLKLPDGVELLPQNLKTRLRCRICPSKNSRKTKTRCQQCLRPLCQKHFIFRCRDCTGVPEAEMDKGADVEEVQHAMSESEPEQTQDDEEFINFK